MLVKFLLLDHVLWCSPEDFALGIKEKIGIYISNLQFSNFLGITIRNFVMHKEIRSGVLIV